MRTLLFDQRSSRSMCVAGQWHSFPGADRQTEVLGAEIIETMGPRQAEGVHSDERCGFCQFNISTLLTRFVLQKAGAVQATSRSHNCITQMTSTSEP